jgi:starch synthase
VTRQKGLAVLLRAIPAIDPAALLVICAGQADTPELEADFRELAEQARILWRQ